MAKKRSGRYRMTPKRRVALRNAQLASARKRKRNALKNVAKGLGQFGLYAGATFATYHINDMIVHPKKAVRRGKATGSFLYSQARKVKRIF